KNPGALPALMRFRAGRTRNFPSESRKAALVEEALFHRLELSVEKPHRVDARVELGGNLVLLPGRGQNLAGPDMVAGGRLEQVLPVDQRRYLHLEDIALVQA